MADDAGALLVRSGLVSASALDDARSRVAGQGGTLGEALVAAGAISDDQLTDFYRQRLLVPQVNPNTLARLSQKVVTSIPSDMAIELRAIPVSLDGDNNLTVAMSDPSDRHAVDEISFFTGSYVVRAVATQMQIAWCLAHYYGHVTALGARLVQPQKAGAPAGTPAGGAPATPGPTAGSAAAAPVAPPVVASPGATPLPRLPRAKGLTGKVEASRHRAIAPVTGQVNPLRPVGSALDRAAPAPPAPPPPDEHEHEEVTIEADEPDEHAGPPVRASSPELEIITDGVPRHQPRARSVSGELRVPVRQRAASIKPPMPDPLLGDDEDDEPMISIEESKPDASGPRMLPVRRRVKSDPPELAARAGEVSGGGAASRIRREPSLDEGPRIIIDDEALVPVGPMSGELRAITQRDEPVPASSIEVDDTSVGVVLDELVPDESEPVLLEVRRTRDMPVIAAAAPKTEPSIPVPAAPASLADLNDGIDTVKEPDKDPDDEVVMLDARKKTPTPRPEKRTQVGIGAVAAPTRAATDEDSPTSVTGRAAPPRADDDNTDETLAAPPDLDEDTSPNLAIPPAPTPPMPPPVVVVGRRRAASVRSRPTPGPAPAPAPAPRPAPRPFTSDDDEVTNLRAAEYPGGPETSEMSAVELDDAVPGRSDAVPAHLAPPRIEVDPVDDGWGPPGTTIPPPLLGALPGIDEDAEDATGDPSRIPVSDLTKTPLIVAPPSPPESARGAPSLPDAAGASLVRALEDATSRAVQLIQQLERTKDRDAVVTLMIAHLGESHMRAGFFSIRPSAEAGKAGELSVFKIQPGPPQPPSATLRLDRPSTLQDVVGTRLPYRGPMHDDASRSFLAGVLGACPPEILLVPVTVRERVVGVLFGEHRLRHTFDDQLALAARAAGMALERILLSKRT